MKDIDFDELDRAVNSVIQNTQSNGVSDSNLSDSSAPVIKNIDAKPSMPMHPSILARRSNGRFMDMVPLSASTRPTPTNPVRVTRQGLDIAPQNNNTNVAQSASEEPKASVITEPVIEEKPSNVWPDPIDNQNFSQGVELVSENNEDADIDQINADIEKTLNPKNDDALETPFISGTKVEKRPLNALSPDLLDEGQDKTIDNVSELSTDTTSVNTIDTGSFNTNMPLPAELGDDLLSIESGNSSAASQSNQLVDQSPKLEIAMPEAPVVNQAVVASAVSNNESIVQQYQEQPNSGDQTNAAIYDTNTYHKAVVKSSRGKSGWLGIVWILLLIVTGGGVGAAVFFLMSGF